MSDYHNPISVLIPYDFQNHQDFPTEVVASRFQAYRDIVKDLISYLRSYASVQEEIVRQQVRLQQAVGAPSQSVTSVVTSSDKSSHKVKDKHSIEDDELSVINQFFLPIGNGSIQDIPTILTKFHQQNIQSGTKTLKEINSVIIPKLEDLRKDLLVKVKEIKNLQNDFKNTLSKEIQDTRNLIGAFNHAIDVANHLDIITNSPAHHDSGSDLETTRKDPYLVKIKLERQLKRQLHEESYLYEAFKNLQSSSEKLESIVVLEIQNQMSLFLNLVENESSSVHNFLVPNLTNGFLAKEPNLEWEAFVQRNLPRASSISNNLSSGKFIDLSFPSRKLSDLSIPHYDSLLNVAVREGPLERRSKFLKSYSGGWYVLTCSYLHEFKTPDRKKDQIPVLSLSLDHCSVSEHSKNDGKASGAYKFVLYSKSQNGLIHRGHNWSFRCDTYQNMIEWYNDIKTLTSLASPSARARAMSKKLMANSTAGDKLSRTSSVVSGQSGLKSLRSNPSRLQSRLSPTATNVSVHSSSVSQRSGVTAARKSKLSSQRTRSPKHSNLINSDGTAVTSVDEQYRGRDSVDKNGNITIRTSLSMERKEQNSDEESVPDNKGVEYKEDGFKEPAQNVESSTTYNPITPSQAIPQNYQYYINQVNQRPQQFYDPVSQQFFTINAIPASQVSQIDPNAQQGIQVQSLPNSNAVQQPQPQQSNGHPQQSNGQPMPQYFPSSPMPNQGVQITPGSPNVVPQMSPTSPQLQPGQYVAVQGENGKPVQYVPHFPSHFNEAGSGNPSYSVNLGEAISQNSTIIPSMQSEPTKRTSSIDETVSKLGISEDK